jgi:hypothetical protein
MYFWNDSMLFKKVNDSKKTDERFIKDLDRKVRVQVELSEDEGICGVVDETNFKDTLGEIKYLLDYGCDGGDKHWF